MSTVIQENEALVNTLPGITQSDFLQPGERVPTAPSFIHDILIDGDVLVPRKITARGYRNGIPPLPYTLDQ